MANHDDPDVLHEVAQKIGRRWASHTLLALAKKSPLRRKDIAKEISAAAHERISDTELTRTINWLQRTEMIHWQRQNWYKTYELTDAGLRRAAELQQLVRIFHASHTSAPRQAHRAASDSRRGLPNAA